MSYTMNNSIFSNEPGFCPNCGTLLPRLQATGGITCLRCTTEFPPEVCLQPERKYIIRFNNIPTSKIVLEADDGNDGPVVERRCPKCNNDKMSYAAIQLRSADEGQTVFFTCTKCGFKENENS